MAKDIILFPRGNLANLPTLEDGEPGWTKDEKALYIGTPTGNERLPNKADLEYDVEYEDYPSGDPVGIQDEPALKAEVGNVAELTTTAKDVVGAINEHNGKLTDMIKVIDINLEDYPRQSGEVDDTPRLNRALLYIKTLPACILHLPVSLTLSDTFKLYPNLMIKGHHLYKTLITWTTGNVGIQSANIYDYDNGIITDFTTNHVISVLMEDVAFIGHPTMNVLFDMRGIWKSFLSKLSFVNAIQLIYCGSKTGDDVNIVSYFNTFDRIILDGKQTSTCPNNTDGVYFEGNCNYAKLHNIEVWNTKYPIRIMGGYVHGDRIDVEGSTGPIKINTTGNILNDIRLDNVNKNDIDTSAMILFDVNAKNNRLTYKQVELQDNTVYKGGRYEIEDKGLLNAINENEEYYGKLKSDNLVTGNILTTSVTSNITFASITDVLFNGLSCYSWGYNTNNNAGAFTSDTITISQDMVDEELTFGAYLKGNNTPPQSAMLVLNGLSRTGDTYYNYLNGTYKGNKWTPMYKTIKIAQEDVGKTVKVAVYPARSTSQTFDVTNLSGNVAKPFIRLGHGLI